jgi:hypothetical protein
VLDDVERRPLLVEPAGKDTLPLLVRLLHVHLDEGAGIVGRLPRRGLLAGAQAHDHVADANRLTRLQLQVAAGAVSLVEEAQHRHPIGHWRRPTRRVDAERQVHGLDIAAGLRFIQRGRALRLDRPRVGIVAAAVEADADEYRNSKQQHAACGG